MKMNQLPTWKDIKEFIVTSWKTMVVSMLAVLVIYAGAIWYSLSSQDELSMKQQELAMGEFAQYDLSTDDYEQLKKDEVSFTFYVENDNDTAFMNYNLLKTYLLSPEVLPQIKESLNLTYEVPDFFVLNIGRDTTEAMNISIGTGNYKDNKALANRLYDLFENEELEIFSGKNVYNLTEPAKTQSNGANGNIETSAMQISTANYYVLAALGVVVALVVGIFVALLQNYLKKEYTNTSLIHFKDVDNVVNLSHLHNNDNINEALHHSIIHPRNTGNKLILAQSSQRLDEILNSETSLLVYPSLLDISEDVVFDEVVLLIEKNNTTKSWVNDQKVLLENYSIPVKVILI